MRCHHTSPGSTEHRPHMGRCRKISFSCCYKNIRLFTLEPHFALLLEYFRTTFCLHFMYVFYWSVFLRTHKLVEEGHTQVSNYTCTKTSVRAPHWRLSASQITWFAIWTTWIHLLPYPFLPEASFGLRVLSSPASVGLCVCVCINHELVRTITHRPFKLGSPNLDQRCKTPWFGSLLFLGMIDLDLQGQI